MLQSLLEERFRLVVRRETKPVSAWVLAAGKQHHLKEADGAGKTGCNLPSSSGAPTEGAPKLFRMNQDGTTTAISLGPGGTVQFSCRNMTMAAFAEGLRTMMGTQLGPKPVIDETGLKGIWNFDVRWSLGLIGLLDNQSEHMSAPEAIDKQLGLKLEQRQVPTPVLTIESVNRTPTSNPPGVAEALPVPPAPKEFDVADVKLAAPATGFPPAIIRIQMQPGGRFVCQNCPLGMMITRAFNKTSNDQIAGMPSGIDSVRVDITAKVPAESRERPWHRQRDDCPAAPRPARRSLQNDVSPGRAASHGVYLDSREAEDEEGRSGEPYLLQARPAASGRGSRFADADLPERLHGVFRRPASPDEPGVELAGCRCGRNRRRMGFHADLQQSASGVAGRPRPGW